MNDYLHEPPDGDYCDWDEERAEWEADDDDGRPDEDCGDDYPFDYTFNGRYR